MNRIDKIISHLIDSWDVHDYLSFKKEVVTVNVSDYIPECNFQQTCVVVTPSWKENINFPKEHLEGLHKIVDLDLYSAIVFTNEDGIRIINPVSKEILFHCTWEMYNLILKRLGKRLM